MSTVPDTIALAPTITCPVLCIRGDQEDPQRYPAEEFQRHAGGHCTVEVVPDCDHFYNGREQTIQRLVCSWLARTIPSRSRPQPATPATANR
ncbi:MAG: alpha/beta hydrolase [Betaproteobacteria bacterium]|nr:alpha/beta hydrolase [Betaproteobacteria bacterium]